MEDVKVALSGYATMDISGRAMKPISLGGTTPITIGKGEWPRAGGAPLYAGKVLAQAGHDVRVIATVGDDHAGSMFLSHLAAAGLSPETVAVHSATRTPACILIHQDDGRYCCFLDRGEDGNEAELSPIQLKATLEADWVIVTAGPASLSATVLDLLLPRQKLVWIFKSDELSFPETLCRRLAQRASVVFCNQHERIALESAGCRFPARTIVFETQGGAGVCVRHDQTSTTVPAEDYLEVDATGAGDTFAGGALSVLFREGASPVTAAKGGLTAAARMLRERLGSGHDLDSNDMAQFSFRTRRHHIVNQAP